MPRLHCSVTFLAGLLGGCQCSSQAAGDTRADLVVDARFDPDRARPLDFFKPDDNWRSAIELVWDRLVAAKAGGPAFPVAYDGSRFAFGATDLWFFDTQATVLKKLPLPNSSMGLSMVVGDSGYGAFFTEGEYKYFVVVKPDGSVDLGAAVKLARDLGALAWSSKLGNYVYHSRVSNDPPQLAQWRFTAAGNLVGSGPVIVEPDNDGPIFKQAAELGSELVLLSTGGKLPKTPGDAKYTAYVRILSPPYTTTKKHDALAPGFTLSFGPVMAVGADRVFVSWSGEGDGRRGVRVSIVDLQGNVTANPPLISQDEWQGVPVAATFFKNHFVLVGGGFPIYLTVYDTSLKQVLPRVNLPVPKPPGYVPFCCAQIFVDGGDLLLLYGLADPFMTSDLRMMRFRIIGL